ncbi:MAG: maleylpyruvate isomerase family mycothiol-dependent enzyme [Acidimicrobiales bacterium]
MTLPLPTQRYVESITADHRRVLSAAQSAPDAPIEACPEWDNTGLLGHLGDVFNFAATQIETGGSEMAAPDMSAKSDPATWYADAGERLIDVLSHTDPDQTSWSWAGIPTASFYFRRMASEIAVHRVDAQRAAGVAVDAVDADIATDAIDEVFEVGMRYRMRGANDQYPSGSLHLHRTDGDGEWMARGVDGRLELTHEHAKGDAAVRGSASDLLLFLWGRGRGDTEIFGDESVAEAWAAVAP